jgi:hypothetical protein
MDQVLTLTAKEKRKTGGPIRVTASGLLKLARSKKGGIGSGHKERGRYHSSYWYPVNNFRGSLRYIRIGDHIHTFYRKQGQIHWTKMCTLRSTQKDTLIGIELQNFLKERNSIAAKRSITAWIDNFTINAAQAIIESEI